MRAPLLLAGLTILALAGCFDGESDPCGSNHFSTDGGTVYNVEASNGDPCRRTEAALSWPELERLLPWAPEPVQYVLAAEDCATWQAGYSMSRAEWGDAVAWLNEHLYAQGRHPGGLVLGVDLDGHPCFEHLLFWAKLHQTGDGKHTEDSVYL